MKRRSDRSKCKLASLRLEIAKAQARLSMLQASIKEARSDAGLAAVQGVWANAQSTPASRAYIAMSLAVDLLMPRAAATCRALRLASARS